MKKYLFFGIFIFFLLFLGFLFNRASDTPSFCKSCHFMEPYVRNWENSPHKEVNCKECHWGPGFREYLAGKVRLLAEVIRYSTGSYNLIVHSKVKDETCLGCHRIGEIREVVYFRGKIPFRHDVHYGSSKRGIWVPCSGCHSELMEGGHLAVREEPCFYCHFLGRPRGEPVGGCPLCHGPPKDTIDINGITFSHKDYLREGISCLTCHVHITRGIGDVKKEVCRRCHLERFEILGDPERVHFVHVTQAKEKCTSCHSKFEHSRIEMASALSPKCEECHKIGHSIQEEIYMGLGGSGVPPIPDPMFLGNVHCVGCHVKKSLIRGTEGPIYSRATKEACVNCHGKGYDNLLSMWQSSVRNYLKRLKEEMGFLERIAPFSESKIVYEYLRGAEENVEIIEKDGSLGAHNIRYSMALLRMAEYRIKAGYEIIREGKEKALAVKLEEKYEGNCGRCHPDVREHSVIFNGESFPHSPHINRYQCKRCHSSKMHGLTKKIDCNSCHHGKKNGCETCHRNEAKIYRGKFFGLQIPNPMYEADVSCADCHLKNDYPAKLGKEGCLRCHEKEYGNLVSSWQEEATEILQELKGLFYTSLSSLERNKGVNAKELLKMKETINFFEKEKSLGIHNIDLIRRIYALWKEKYGKKIE